MKREANREGHRKTGEARRAEIADVAMRVIAESGAKRFTAKAVAREIGISDAAVFRHFETMEAIVEAITERMEEILFADFPPAHEDPIDRLGAFFAARVRAIGEQPHLSRLLLSDHLAQAGGEKSVARVREFKRRSQKFVRGCLAEAERRRLLAPGIGPDDGTVLVLGAVLALSHASATVAGPRSIGPLSRRVWAALERLLRGNKRRDEAKRAPRALTKGRKKP